MNNDENIIYYEQGYIISFFMHKIIENQTILRCDLSIQLLKSLSNTQDLVTLKFYGVKDLCVENSINGIYYSSLTVKEIKNWQWEGCNYQVIDEEEDCIKFYCSHISGIPR
jgi:hypothetical protein